MVRPRAHARTTSATGVARDRANLLYGREAVDPRLVMLAQPDSARAFAFRQLCDGLLEKGVPRVIAVSSAAPNEGKTTCALNLALAFAERRGRVLVVDANFFEPEHAEIFGLEEGIPTSACLDLPWLDPYMIVELAPCLHVATMPRHRTSAARFDTRSFAMLIDLLSGLGYDRLVIDTPALDGTAAVTRVVAVADAVLLTVRSGRTTTRALRRAVERVAPGKLLGATLMDAELL
jgi:Mrp family chromosome partitioning ATPase